MNTFAADAPLVVHQTSFQAERDAEETRTKVTFTNLKTWRSDDTVYENVLRKRGFCSADRGAIRVPAYGV